MSKKKGKNAGQITHAFVYTLRYVSRLSRTDMAVEDPGPNAGRVTITAEGDTALAELWDERTGTRVGEGYCPMEVRLERLFCEKVNDPGNCVSRVP